MNLFMTFIIYSVIGWLWETVYCLVKYKRFVFCGVLLGPYCPVYGCSIATILLLTRDIQNSNHLFLLYLFIVLIVTLIEWSTHFWIRPCILTFWSQSISFDVDL